MYSYTKVNLYIALPGSVMYSEQVCSENTTKTKKEGKVKVYRDPMYFDNFVTQMQDFNKKGNPVGDPKDVYVYTRKAKNSILHKKINNLQYDYMVSPNSYIDCGKSRTEWLKLSKKHRIIMWCQHLCNFHGGESFTFDIIDE